MTNNKSPMKNVDIRLNFLIALTVSFLLFIFAPMEMYFSSKDYFFFGGMEILKYTFCFGLFTFLILSVAFFVIELRNITIWKYIISVVFSTIILFYFQGNYWLVNYGALDGEKVDWNKFFVEGIVDSLLWLSVWTIGIVATYKIDWRKLEKIYKYVCICMILIQSITLMSLCINKGGINKTPEYLSTNEHEFEYSRDDNLIVIMLDSFDATVLSEIVNGEDGEIYRDILSDFTFYPDTTGMYSYTALAVPYILTGDEYLNDMTYGKYLEQAYSNSPVLNKAKEEKWRIGIYNVTTLPQTEISLVAENVELVHNTASSHRRLLKYYYKLIAYKYMPQVFKQYFWFYPDEMISGLIDNEENVTVFSEDNFVFKENYRDRISGDLSQPTFRFYTLFGAHQPYHTTEEFEYSDEETDVYQTSKGVLIMLDEYLDELREADVYDNSNIIILADHGIINRVNPLFLVKYAGNSESFEERIVPFSYAELQSVLVALMDGCKKEEIEIIMKDKVPNKRRFLSYMHSSGFGYDTYFEDIKECYVSGSPNSYLVEQTGKIYCKP